MAAGSIPTASIPSSPAILRVAGLFISLDFSMGPRAPLAQSSARLGTGRSSSCPAIPVLRLPCQQPFVRLPLRLLEPTLANPAFRP
jgi:hypothetical protein